MNQSINAYLVFSARLHAPQTDIPRTARCDHAPAFRTVPLTWPTLHTQYRRQRRDLGSRRCTSPRWGHWGDKEADLVHHCVSSGLPLRILRKRQYVYGK